MKTKFKVKIRRGEGWGVKPEAEKTDGKIYEFEYGWIIDEDDPKLYRGETAWLPRDDSYPDGAPMWIASGDLVEQ